MDTSIVTLKAVQEIQDFYDYTVTQKIKALFLLLMAFILGAFSYFLDVGADYKLLYDHEYNKKEVQNKSSKHFNGTESQKEAEDQNERAFIHYFE